LQGAPIESETQGVALGWNAAALSAPELKSRKSEFMSRGGWQFMRRLPVTRPMRGPGHTNQPLTEWSDPRFSHKHGSISGGAFLTVEVAHLVFRVARSRDGVGGNRGLDAVEILGC
jgi:hypothetical protein